MLHCGSLHIPYRFLPNNDRNFWLYSVERERAKESGREENEEKENSLCNKVNELILCVCFGYHFSEPYEPKPVLNAALTVVRGHSASMDLVLSLIHI